VLVRHVGGHAIWRPIEGPTFDLPHRRYHLAGGDALDVTERADLWWPDDRARFVATDVDFWVSYVGGTAEAIAAVEAAAITATRRVTLDEELVDED
jgi:hypothetical protein